MVRRRPNEERPERLLVYVDSKAPSKLIETRDKLVQGLATGQTGIRAINARRRSFGLRAI